MTHMRRRRGFALVWAIMAIGVLAVVFAATAPKVISAIDQAKVQATYTTVAAIDTAINAFATVVRTAGGAGTRQFPGKVSELAIPITATDLNSCGAAMTGTSSTTWAANGPFVKFYAPKGSPTLGLSTPLGQVNDALERVNNNSNIFIRIPAVEPNLVTLMDLLVDNGDGGAAGKVRFVAAVNGLQDLTFMVTPFILGSC